MSEKNFAVEFVNNLKSFNSKEDLKKELENMDKENRKKLANYLNQFFYEALEQMFFQLNQQETWLYELVTE